MGLMKCAACMYALCVGKCVSFPSVNAFLCGYQRDLFEGSVDAFIHRCIFMKHIGPEDHGKLATIYKSEKRNEMVNNGFRILGNSGDQWSDLLGASMSIRSFKLPNPMYYIP
ncbi:hypothetical protein Pint_18041 [Pistacia integerrima]|uniref:Uncharacterized protein n=1 Tax=Pistacia integerrima TaxID=434235 RepID=A0ACC0YTQ8_9ROSI|nr:hypothetical protein Pint_18041 [Pistacia integerrima]